jgi:hypothetical protein
MPYVHSEVILHERRLFSVHSRMRMVSHNMKWLSSCRELEIAMTLKYLRHIMRI